MLPSVSVMIESFTIQSLGEETRLPLLVLSQPSSLDKSADGISCINMGATGITIPKSAIDVLKTRYALPDLLLQAAANG